MAYSPIIKQIDNRKLIYDDWRRRYVRLTPEELVRQYILHDLTEIYGYPKNRFAVEKTVEINGQPKRADAVLYGDHADPIMILEFKAPQILINQKVFDQISTYNTQLHVPFLLVSNGTDTLVCKVVEGKYVFAHQIPSYNNIIDELVNN